MKVDDVNIGDIVRIEITNSKKQINLSNALPFIWLNYTLEESSLIVGYCVYKGKKEVKISNYDPLKKPPKGLFCFSLNYPYERIKNYEIIKKADSPMSKPPLNIF
jgi:hypothetical protein